MEQIVSGRITLIEAVRHLGVSYRQAKRLKNRYVADGVAGLAHKNRGRKAVNAVPGFCRAEVTRLYEEKYRDFNDTHFTEKLKEHEGISLSRETVRSILRGAGKKPKRKRRAKKHYGRRARKELFGMMVQWDGSPHRWFGPDRAPCCLMAAVDDATGRLLGALFVPAESSAGYLKLLEMILRRHGVPLSIYHDRHSSLVRTDDYWSLEEQLQGFQHPTHVGRVLDELGITSIPAYSPQAKGRIERRFGVLQDRMIADMRLAGITDMGASNKWLEELYIDAHNAMFAKPAPEKGSAFRKISKKEVRRLVAFAYETIVGNDNCARLGGIIIDIPPGKNGRGYAKQKVLVRQHLDGTWSVWKGDEKIASHRATEFKQPVRSWKRKAHKTASKDKQVVQVYIASKPAPPKKGHFPLAVRGTY
jgi:transposase